MHKEELISKLIEDFNIKLNQNQLNQIDSFCNYLISENEKYNLTAITKLNDIYLKHIYDSLSLSKIVNFNQITSTLDIGTGAGFPGIVLAIAFPTTKFTLLDSNNKKIKFLNQVTTLLNLTNVEIIYSRAEEYIKNKRESFDLVVSRAVARLNILTELALPFVKKDHSFIAMKGDAKEEITESKYAIKELGGEIKDIYEFFLPIENSSRTLIKITKKFPTSEKYPRSYDKIIKNSLKK